MITGPMTLLCINFQCNNLFLAPTGPVFVVFCYNTWSETTILELVFCLLPYKRPALPRVFSRGACRIVLQVTLQVTVQVTLQGDV